MLLQTLREAVLEANLELVRRGLVLYTFGNASGISRKDGYVVIKPSGVPYESLLPEHMVIANLNGEMIDGDLRPSSDLPTHIQIYRQFSRVGGIVHTHSEYATSWAQAAKPIPCLGTTHADYFHGEVPVTPALTPEEIAEDYEKNTGLVIGRRFQKLDPDEIPGVLVASHGPFCWGPTPGAAAHTAVILEALARTALYTIMIQPNVSPIARELLDKHFLRKHGQDAYYGQVKAK